MVPFGAHCLAMKRIAYGNKALSYRVLQQESRGYPRLFSTQISLIT